MRKVVALSVLLSMAGMCQAALYVTVQNMGPSTPPPTGYTIYHVYVDTTVPGDPCTVWNGDFLGPMFQAWVAGMIPTPTKQYAAMVDADDSHFMFMDADILPAETPTESLENPVAGYLSGAFGIKPYATSDHMLLAQITIPPLGQVRMVGEIGNGVGHVWPVDLIIPEPATLAVLAVGAGLVLLRRRR